MNKFWKVTNAVDSSDSTLILEGPIASESWWGDEVTPQAFRDELKKISSKNLTVSINSVGGDVWAGVAIYNALKELDAEVTVRVDGLAASIASVIAMAGDKIIMSPGSMMMIHRASSIAFGNAEEMEKAIEMLKVVDESITGIYTSRTGLTADQVSDMMDAETWMTADKAVELGFADEAGQAKQADDKETISNMFSSKMLAMTMSASKESLESFISQVEAKADEDEALEVTEETQTEEATETAEATTEVETEKVEEVAETPTEITNPAKEETNQMEDDKTQAIAQSQVQAPSATAVAAPNTASDYLKTKASLEDFANVLAQNAGKDAAEVKAAWADHLSVKMNITNPEIMLPQTVITSIEDAFKEGGAIWNLVDKTGLDVFRAAVDTVTGEDSRAKGHTRGNTKNEEVITLADRTIRAQFIYKYLTLDKETVRENRSTGALLRYVLSELPRRIVRELERAIVIGDGRADADVNKVKSFVSLKADAADGTTPYASTYTPEAGQGHYESLLRAKALVKTEGPKYLITKSSYLTETLLETNANGGYLFAPGTDLGRAFGFAGVIEPDWMEEDTTNDAYVFVPNAYKTVGDNSIESFTNFTLKENKNEYLQEIYHGGALAARDSAVAIALTPAAV